MKKILYLLFVVTMTNIQGIMAQEKITQTAEADGKAAFQREMIFPIGEPNTAYAKYFIGNSYLAPISKEQIPFNNVTFEPGMSLSSRAAATTGTFIMPRKAVDSWFAHLAFEVPGENTSNGYADMFL